MEKLSFLYGEISPQTLVTQKNSFCYCRDKYVAYSAKVGQLVFQKSKSSSTIRGISFPSLKFSATFSFRLKNPNRSVLAHINLICLLKARSKTTWEFRKDILRILLKSFRWRGAPVYFFVLSVLCFPKQSKTLCKEW